jgi:hypothetical protein
LALGVERHERGEGRRGYRHGYLPEREVATSHGVVSVRVPRARVWTADGSEEYKSRYLSRKLCLTWGSSLFEPSFKQEVELV